MARRFTVHIDVPDDMEFPLDADTVYSMLWAIMDVGDGEVTVEVVFPEEQGL